MLMRYLTAMALVAVFGSAGIGAQVVIDMPPPPPSQDTETDVAQPDSEDASAAAPAQATPPRPGLVSLVGYVAGRAAPDVDYSPFMGSWYEQATYLRQQAALYNSGFDGFRDVHYLPPIGWGWPGYWHGGYGPWLGWGIRVRHPLHFRVVPHLKGRFHFGDRSGSSIRIRF